MVGSDGLRSGVVGVEKVVGDAGQGAPQKRGSGLRRMSLILQACADAYGQGDDLLQVLRQFPGQQLVLHQLCQAMEEVVHQGSSLPAAVGS